MTTAAVAHPRVAVASRILLARRGAPLPFNRQVAAAIRYVVEHYQDQPALEAMAAAAGMSPSTSNASSSAGRGSARALPPVRHAGPRQAGARATTRACSTRRSTPGSPGPSRLHDLFVSCTALTPGEFKALGERLVIRWGVHDVPLGRVLIGVHRARHLLARLHQTRRAGDRRVRARMARRPACATRLRPPPRRAFDRFAHRPAAIRCRSWCAAPTSRSRSGRRCCTIPIGRLVSYQAIALGDRPAQGGAVGRAVGANHISLADPPATG